MTARAVVVLPKGSDRPVMGYLIRQDERTVVVRQELPGGKSRDTPFARSEIDELIITVAPERLAELDPARPQLYREYAEELAEKQRDPEAHDAAIRLYAICAARGDEKLRHGALLGLIPLARSPHEERLFRAAAYLYDPDHDEAILIAPSKGAATRGGGAANADLLAVLRLARQGKASAAKAILDRPAGKAEAAQIASIITLEELEKACSPRPLTNQQLKQLLRAELALDAATAPASAESPAGRPTGWSAAKRTSGLSPLPLLSLERLTEFDPAACVYRGDKWVRP